MAALLQDFSYRLPETRSIRQDQPAPRRLSWAIAQVSGEDRRPPLNLVEPLARNWRLWPPMRLSTRDPVTLSLERIGR
jgi:hypothetical protein